MGSKHDTKKTKPVQTDPAHEASRLIEKGNYKEAIKQAKLGFREAGSAENHRLLEKAYFLRARQLLGRAMAASAREVAGHLLEFGVTDPTLVADTAALLVSLGMIRESLQLQGRLDSPESKERLFRQAADQAVLHPERSGDHSPELRTAAGQVRAALEALAAGDEAGMVERLRDIPRSSPLADWKLFARGLAAFYRGARDEASVAWDRLDPDRASARIARVLLGRADAAKQPKIPLALEKQVLGTPVLASLEQLRDLVAQERWSEAVRAIGPLKYSLRQVDPALSVRLTRVLYGSIIRAAGDLAYEKARQLVHSFIKVSEPLPVDPHWNRLWALLWEGPRGNPDDADRFWLEYIKDLQEVSSFSPDERGLAQALVMNKLAGELLEEAEQLRPDDEDEDWDDLDGDGDPEEAEALFEHATTLLEASVKVCPTHLPTYLMLIDAQLAVEREQEAAAIARRLLERFPDHTDTLKFLALYELNDDPKRGVELVRRVRKLKPLDEDLVDLEWYAHVAAARAYALERRWEEGRAEFAAADAIAPASKADESYLAKKAVFEFKAGQDDAAEALVAQAQSLLEEPTPLWLALEIEARRFQLPRARIKLYADRFRAAIKARGKGKPATCRLLAELVLAYVASGVNYTGREKHVADVRTYLKNNLGLKFSSDELRAVCEFFARFPYKRSIMLEDLARRGRRQYPESPYFLLLLPSLQIKRTPWAFLMTHYRKDLEKALELAQASSDRRDTALVPKIKSALAAITGPPGFHFPFAGFGPRGAPGEPAPEQAQGGFFDAFEDDWVGADGDDWDDDPRPQRGGSRRGR